ncbi:MAG: hemolysin secretion protein D [Methylobacterium sp.]|nr:MAG: hemolysin secretion protein D [Methylobacterium sp.]
MNALAKSAPLPPAVAESLPPEPRLRGLILGGILMVLIGFGGFLLWAFTTAISGAVIASGQFVAESDVKRVQHPQGGTVGRILVRNGDRVAAGDLLVMLDDTIPRTNLGQIVSQLRQLLARRGRLEAERDDRAEIRFPPELASLGPEAAEIAQAETRLLAELRATRAAQRQQLTERIGQLQREIEGLTAQAEAKKREVELIAHELTGVEDLYQKNLVPITRMMILQREAARLTGETGALVASTAKARGQIAEINVQLLTLDQTARSDAAKELREVETLIAQLQERRIAALDILNRIEIRSPQTGFVHEQNVKTVGGVISPGETLMLIVPEGDKLTIEARVSPIDIDQVKAGQKAHLRLSALNQRTTPELRGHVTRVAADLSREQAGSIPFYTVRLQIDDSELKRFDARVLVPGMPVDVFIETGERSVMSYLTRPLTDAFARSFRED